MQLLRHYRLKHAQEQSRQRPPSRRTRHPLRLAAWVLVALVGLVVLLSNAAIRDWLRHQSVKLNAPANIQQLLAGRGGGSQQSAQAAELGAVLADVKVSPQFIFSVNVPSVFRRDVQIAQNTSIAGSLLVTEEAVFNAGMRTNNGNGDFGTGIVTAGNIPAVILSGVTAGTGLSVDATDPAIPTIANTGVLSLGGSTGALSLSAGSGISVDGLTITNAGVTSFQGSAGAITLAAGPGITISGSTITNSSPSQWTSDGTSIGYASGNVGIGTSSPSQLFDVTGGTGIVGQFSGRVIGGDAVNSNEFATLGQISGGAGQYWQRNLGTLSPTNVSDDVFVGGSSTGAALLRFSSAGSIFFDGDLELSRGAANRLDLSSGDRLNLVSGSLEVGGTTVISSTRLVQAADGAASGPGYAFASDTATGMYRAGANTLGFATGGSERLTINGSGVLTAAGYGTGVAQFDSSGVLSSSALNLAGGSTLITGTLPIGNGGTNTASIGSAGSVAYSNGTTYGFTTVGNSGQVLTSGGAGAPTWIDAAAVGTNYWQRSLGTLAPVNITDDLLLGGTSSASARFAFLNAAAGTPTASLSGNLAVAVPTGTNPAATLNILNGGSLNLQTSVGGDAGLSSRLFVANNGNIGIGTTVPAQKLELSSGGAGDTVARITHGLQTDRYLEAAYETSTSNAYLNFTTGGVTSRYLDFRYAGSSKMALTGAGNLGIGTTSPLSQLHLNAAAQALLAMSDTRTSGNQLGRIVYDGGTTITGGGWVFQKMTDAGAFSANLVTIVQNTGNVGIGTTAPSRPFHVSTSAIVAALIENTGAGANSAAILDLSQATATDSLAMVRFANDASGWSVGIDGSDSDKFKISRSLNSALSNSRFTIDLGGNVGIGITTPTAKLDVVGDASVSASLVFGVAGTNTIDVLNGDRLDFQTSPGGDAGLSPRLTLLSNGNVGIGTTGPTSLLQVAGSGGVYVTTPKDLFRLYNTDATATNNTAAMTFLANRSGGIATEIASISAILRNNGATTYTGALTFAVAGTAAIPTERMRIDASGNVGIGTTVPSGAFDIGGGTFYWANYAPDSCAMLSDYIEGSKQVKFTSAGCGTGESWLFSNASSANILKIESAGNIGVGTTTPTARLDISGSASVSGSLAFTGAGTAHTLDYLDGGTLNIRRSPGGTAGQSTAMFFSASGNIGIGTTGPIAKVDIVGSQLDGDQILRLGIDRPWCFTQNGTGGGTALGLVSDCGGANIKNFYIEGNNVGIGTTAPTSKLDIAGSASLSANLAFTGSSTAHTLDILDGGSLNIRRSPGGVAGQATAMFVGANGNVGIGTTNPGAQLDLSTDSARKLTTTTWTTGSDARIKTDVQTINNALDVIGRVRPVKYHYTPEYLAAHPSITDTDYYSFIAQEYREVFPQSVSEIDGLFYLNSSNMIPYAIAGIKELDQKLALQEARVSALAALAPSARATTPSEVLGDSSALAGDVAALGGRVEQVAQLAQHTASEAAFLKDLMTAPLGLPDDTPSLAQSLAALDVADTATISGTLTVLGRTMLADLGVTGHISAGLLSIDGLAGELSTLAGPLKLQAAGLAGVEFVGGKLTIDTEGNLHTSGEVKAKTGTFEKLDIPTSDPKTAAAGKAAIPAEEERVTIETARVTSSSLIFVTATAETDVPLVVERVLPGRSFTVELVRPQPQPVSFNWWVVN